MPQGIDEFAAGAVSRARAGALMRHRPVRGGDGCHGPGPGHNCETSAAVGAACDVVIRPSVGRIGLFAPTDMMAVRHLPGPGSVSLDLQQLLDPDDGCRAARVRGFPGAVGYPVAGTCETCRQPGRRGDRIMS